MSYDYSSLASTATKLIRKFGRNVSVLVKYESAEPWNPDILWDESPAMAIQTQLKKGEADGSLIQSSDKVFLIESAATIDTKNRIRDAGVDYSIVQFQELKPGDTVMLYRVIVRK